MFKIFTFFLIVFGISFQISAQCGVYFKESNRQVFSNSFANAAFEDFDGDGLEDLFGYSATRYINGGSSDFQIYYYKRLAANSFDTTAKVSSITNIRGTYGGFGDVDGDGKKDLVVTHTSGGFQTIRAYLNDGTGRFLTPTPVVDVPGGETVFAVSDLNGDGRADVVTSGFSGGNSTIAYRLAQPDNSFGAAVPILTYPGFISNLLFASNILTYGYPMLIEDFNNDGLKDIAFVYLNTNSQSIQNLVVLTNNGSLTFTQSSTTLFVNVKSKLRAYDFNNDGKKDFVSHSVSNQLKLAINNGNNTFTTSTLTLPVGTQTGDTSYGSREFSVADFDNDGDQDIIYLGFYSYALFKNQGDGTFTTQSFKPQISLDAVTNLDNDGKADSIALIRPFIDGGYFLFDGSNKQYFYRHSAVSFRKNVCSPVGQTKKVDFDGNGYVDRAFFNTTNGNWRRFTDLTGSTVQNFQWGLAGDKPVPNDYDGDGLTDYAVFRPSNGTWWVFRSSDNQSYAVSFGISEDKPVPADYDGDGKADIAVFRPSTGDWHFLMSQTGQYGVLHFGAAGDKPVPADYDGDGKADVSVFRPSESVWYRFNSSDFSVFVLQYGISTDKPVPGDYDGDGKANIAVFRNGVWYVLKNDFSTGIINWGAANDEPYFDEAVQPTVYVFRRSNSLIYLADAVSILFPFTNSITSGNTTNEVLASSILPPE
jgi:hypothetical protein